MDNKSKKIFPKILVVFISLKKKIKNLPTFTYPNYEIIICKNLKSAEKKFLEKTENKYLILFHCHHNPSVEYLFKLFDVDKNVIGGWYKINREPNIKKVILFERKFIFKTITTDELIYLKKQPLRIVSAIGIYGTLFRREIIETLHLDESIYTKLWENNIPVHLLTEIELK